jgi:RNA polymerase sigma-B factor
LILSNCSVLEQRKGFGVAMGDTPGLNIHAETAQSDGVLGAESEYLEQLFIEWHDRTNGGEVDLVEAVSSARSGDHTGLLESAQGYLVMLVLSSESDSPEAAYGRAQAATVNLVAKLPTHPTKEDIFDEILTEARTAIDNPLHALSEDGPEATSRDNPAESQDTHELTQQDSEPTHLLPVPDVETETAEIAVPSVGLRLLEASRLRRQTPDALFRRLADGDQMARERLAEDFMPLARKLANRYARSSEDLDDLIQVASLGLVKALDRYDGSRGIPFSAFATPTILGELRRHFRDYSWGTHVPRSLQEKALAVRDFVTAMQQSTGRDPNVKEVASYLNVPEDQALEAFQALTHGYNVESLDTPVDTENNIETRGAQVGDPSAEAAYEHVTLHADVLNILKELDPRMQLVVVAALEGWTQARTGERLGVSQMQVSRYLRRVRTLLNEELLDN